MPRPKQGDFVLWDDETWVIEEIRGKIAIISLPEDEIEEEVLINSLAPTPIKTWELE